MLGDMSVLEGSQDRGSEDSHPPASRHSLTTRGPGSETARFLTHGPKKTSLGKMQRNIRFCLSTQCWRPVLVFDFLSEI